MRRLYAASLAAVLTLGAAACSADDPEPKFADRSETPSAEVPTSSTPPAAQRPTESEVALQPNAQGAREFTKYFWAEVSYAQSSGDVSGIRKRVSSSCDSCLAAAKAIVQSNHGGRDSRGGEIRVTKSQAQIFSPDDGRTTAASVKFTTRNADQEILRDGKVIQRFDAATLENSFLLTYTEEHWRVDLWRVNTE